MFFSKRIARGAVFSFLLLCAGFLVAGESLVVHEIAEGFFVFYGQHAMPNKGNQGQVANIGFIVGNRCVAVIDTGGSPAQGRQLLSAIREKSSKPICYVINTHVHPDHILGNLAFKEMSTHFVGHKKLPRAMALRGKHYQNTASQALDILLPDDVIVLPDIVVEEALDLDLGGRTITLRAYQSAHTDNDLTIFDRQTGTLWLSDLLFSGHVPVLDGSINGWIAVIEQLQTGVVAMAVPGHGLATKKMAEQLVIEKQYLETVRREVREIIQQGGTMRQAMEQVGQLEKRRWSLFDQFHKRTVSAAFAELEWED